MTTNRFRELVKRLMPRRHDESLGRNKAALLNVLASRRRRMPRCWCGEPTRGKHCQLHTPTRFRRLRPLLASLALIASSAPAAESPRGAQVFAVTKSVRLAWDASATPGVSYRVYYTRTMDYGLSWVDAGQNLTATVGGLDRRTKYRFRAIAIDQRGNASDPSNELRYTTPK